MTPRWDETEWLLDSRVELLSCSPPGMGVIHGAGQTGYSGCGGRQVTRVKRSRTGAGSSDVLVPGGTKGSSQQVAMRVMDGSRSNVGIYLSHTLSG